MTEGVRATVLASLLAVVLGTTAAAREPREIVVAPGGTGTGTAEAPLGSIQEALAQAGPGDTVLVMPGEYAEALSTVTAGTADAPIVLKSAEPRKALVSVAGKVLFANHAFVIVEGFVFDGQYAPADTLDIENDADNLILRDLEVRHSGNDCIDINGPDDVLIEDVLVHHCLNPARGRTDAHGITAGHVRNLTVRRAEIHTFSGDGFQIDPDRNRRGWDGVLLEDCRIWQAPLPAPEHGFAEGAVPGENAVDLKAHNRADRGTITIRRTEAFGFRHGMITNLAAFNLKENTRTVLDGVTVHDSEIAFRVRGPTGSRPAGAWVTLMNSVVYDVDVAVRYENSPRELHLLNDTFGTDIGRAFVAAKSPQAEIEVRNTLYRARFLPGEAKGSNNMTVGDDAFVDVRGGDYRLRPGAKPIDQGETIPEVTVDRTGAPRPAGTRYDIGAYEFGAQPPARVPPGARAHDLLSPAEAAGAGAPDSRRGPRRTGVDGRLADAPEES